MAPHKKHSKEERQAFGKWLRQRRLAKNLTHQDLATHLKLSKNAVMGYERGSFYPQDATTVEDLEKLFGEKFDLAVATSSALTIHAAKVALSRNYGVPVAAIDITIRTRFDPSSPAPALTIEDAKRALSNTYGVPEHVIRIIIPRQLRDAAPLD